MFKRVIEHVGWLRRARYLGIPPFLLRSRFVIPRSIKLGGKDCEIRVPQLTSIGGISGDFHGCVLGDDYGLVGVKQPPETILDIGGHLGFFSLAARAFHPGARVHTYEPNPLMEPYICLHSRQMGFGYFPEAVGAQEGLVEMGPHGEDCRFGRTRRSPYGTITQVSLSTAIERLGGTVDFLKLGCVGAEWDLFQAKETWRSVRFVSLEYFLSEEQKYPALMNAMDELGFQITAHWPHPYYEHRGLVQAFNKVF